MFRGMQIHAYFSKVGTKKSGSGGGSSFDTLPALVSSSREGEVDLIGSEETPITLGDQNQGGSQTGSIGSSSQLREYPATDPRYVHEVVRSPKRAHETPNSVCNQPRHRRRSNPAVKLITPTRLGVPLAATVLDLTTSSENGPIEVGSDTADVLEACEQDLDPEVEEWLTAQQKGKVSYEVTRRFQESWPAKLPWSECVKGPDGLYDFVRCLICSDIEHKEKILQPKFDTLKKHGGKRKAKTAIPSRGIRKGQW